MRFEPPLISGKLIRRYKRFLADIELADGQLVTAHCTNSGTMTSCLENDAPVFLSPAKNPNRKTKYTWEMIYINKGWVGINTLIPNHLVYEALLDNSIKKLSGYTTVKREVHFDDSRFDIYAENEFEKCFIEVKNVTMKIGSYARFPDAVTSRGKKHLETLIKVKQSGFRAIMVYIIQRSDVTQFGSANEIDPAYAEALERAVEKGVEIIPLMAKVSPQEIFIDREIPYNP